MSFSVFYFNLKINVPHYVQWFCFLLFFAGLLERHEPSHEFVFVMTGVLLKLFIIQWFINVNNANNEGMFQEVWTCNE